MARVRSEHPGLLIVAALAVAAAGAFVAGRATVRAGAVAPVPARGPDDPRPAAAPERLLELASPALVEARAPAVEPAAPAARPPAKLTPELVQRVAMEARVRLEEMRDLLAERCGARDASRSGRAPARLTVNLTFAADGREIARGFSEDRRGPPSEVGRCLRRLRGAELRVSPPGTNVGVSLPLTLP